MQQTNIDINNYSSDLAGIHVPSNEQLTIRTDSLSKTFKMGKETIRAINNVSLDVRQGEFIVLTGVSGSGKSTLLQMLGGLDRPTNGTITIDGTDIINLSDRELSRFRGQKIGFVFQFFYLQPFLRLRRNIEVPGMFARLNRKERRARTDELVKVVGLSDRLDHYPKELSGGQIQRAAVVRALLNQPKILLADEPTGNLDSENSAAIIDLFFRLREQFGTTIVIATHDPVVAAKADRIITLQDGAIV